MAYSFKVKFIAGTYVPPPPHPQEGIFNSECRLNCLSAICLDSAGAKICLNLAK